MAELETDLTVTAKKHPNCPPFCQAIGCANEVNGTILPSLYGIYPLVFLCKMHLEEYPEVGCCCGKVL